MGLNNIFTINYKIKTFLIFFYCLFLLQCKKEEKRVEVKLFYKESKAISATFFSDANPKDFKFYLKNKNDDPILGSFFSDGMMITFTPVVPFTNGLEYEMFYKENSLTSFKIDKNDIQRITEIQAIYPSSDSVPENLLKIYIEFSHSMQEVDKVLNYIKVVNTTYNEEVNPFLELENELWNKEHTRLTLWLNPGRIKRDLIPNIKEGMPLKEGENYELVLDKNWKDAQGNQLGKNYSKKFTVIKREDRIPDVNSWKIMIPAKSVLNPLEIQFEKPLDAILISESFQIYDESSIELTGNFELIEEEKGLLFYPDKPWEKGKYQVLIDVILEDLAGNNLDHVFDRDILKESNDKSTGEYKTLFFTIN